MTAMQAVKEDLAKAPDGQLSQTDPDARSMKTRGTGVVGYNVQASVETKHHLIIDHEVTNISSDRTQLSSRATRACDVLHKESITAIADRGYYTRWGHEQVIEEVQLRLDHTPDAMRIRRSTVEHVFGTLKLWMGLAHFLTGTLKRVGTEMSLHVLAYNMKRVMNIVQTEAMMKAM